MSQFGQPNNDVSKEIMELRSQGLPDNIIIEELKNKGRNPVEINNAITQIDTPDIGSMNAGMQPNDFPSPRSMQMSSSPEPQMPSYEEKEESRAVPSEEQGNIYERIEEIAESMIDEKWDELITEVKKIVEWKEKIEERQTKMQSELGKLKEDFTVLHQGVLGKLEDYDGKMTEVGTELKAVGQVFKDVIPEFVENVKELKDVTSKIRK